MPESQPLLARRIVYLAHGADKYKKQAIYSLHTLLHWILAEPQNDIAIWVYTEDSSWVPQHPAVSIQHLSKEKLDEYKGEHRYVHRVKLAVLADASQQGHGAILFVDCDTQWIRSPVNAFAALEASNNLCFMHEFENNLSTSVHPEYLAVMESDTALQQRLGLHPPWAMWNSGTIGIPAGNTGFFFESLQINDELLGKVRNKNWIEQLAVSLVAASRFKIQSFDDYLLHFWRDSYALERIMEKALSNLSGDLGHDTKACIEFPVEQELKKFRKSIAGRWLRRRLRFKKSIARRLPSRRI